MKSLILIPARMAATRLPGKPLELINDEPLLLHTYRQAKKTKADSVMVVTPDREIEQICELTGMLWHPSSETAESGTARCAEVVYKISPDSEVDVIINWQVDEPLVEPADVDKMIYRVRELRKIQTLVAPLADEDITNINVVKAAVTETDRAAWFSRKWAPGAMHHIGIYGYTVVVLLRLQNMPQTALAKEYSLEQLTWLENGVDIEIVRTAEAPLGINTRDDLLKMRELFDHAKHRNRNALLERG